MALSLELLEEEPEQLVGLLQRQRRSRIAMTVVGLVAAFGITGVFVTLAYQNGPEAAASPVNQASP
jgi:hypothetical protein